MLDGEEWKAEAQQGVAPTKEDMVRFAKRKSTILIQTKFLPFPVEATVEKVLNDGEVFRTGQHWVNTSDVRILHWFPPKPPKPPMLEGLDPTMVHQLAERYMRSMHEMMFPEKEKKQRKVTKKKKEKNAKSSRTRRRRS